MAAQDYASPNTYDTLRQAPLGNVNNVRQLWKKGAILAEQNEDFFQQMEGRSEKSPIWAQSDLSKGEGSIMNFTTQAGFYGRGKKGDGLFEVSTDFEKIRQGNFQLKIDFLRNAVRTNKRMEEIMGMKGDIESGVNVELGKWLGRQKTTQVFGLFMHRLPAVNVLYAGGKQLDTLKTADIFRWDEAVIAGHTLMPMGGIPAEIQKKGQDPILSQTFVSSVTNLLGFKLDTAWKQVLREGDVRGQGNTIFKGGFPSVDGHTIVPFNPINHDGVGPMGSFLNPQAYLGGAADTAHDAGGAALVVRGGGNATDIAEADFFEYFPNGPFTFIDTGAITPTTSERFFIIYNTTGAAAGKWGMYAYTTGNNGNQITTTKRLAGTNTGVGQNLAVVGGVTWDNNLNTSAHPPGSLVFPCNSFGVPIGSTLVMGRSAILRGYGSLRADHTMDSLNGNFITDRYITSIFGQTFKQDRLGRVISALRMDHAISIPGVSLPVRS